MFKNTLFHHPIWAIHLTLKAKSDRTKIATQAILGTIFAHFSQNRGYRRVDV